jgi:hypothetical protein
MKSPAGASNSGNQPSSRSTGDEFRDIRSQCAKSQALAQEEGDVQRTQAQVRAARLGSTAASGEELVQAVKERDEQRHKFKERGFKTQHAGVLGMLGWIL